MSQITIYHNPACGTSRNALALIRHSGEEPEIIEYLPSPPSRETLQALIRAMGMPVRELLRRKGTPFDVLINRPIVVTPLGTRLCRPSERVLDILPQALRGPFAKEDGEVVVDAKGRRVASACSAAHSAHRCSRIA